MNITINAVRGIIPPQNIEVISSDLIGNIADFAAKIFLPHQPIGAMTLRRINDTKTFHRDLTIETSSIEDGNIFILVSKTSAQPLTDGS